MSIKIVHIIFITLSVICSFIFAVWAVQYSLYTHKGLYLAAGLGSAVLGVLLIIYGRFFYKKIKTLNL